MESGIDLSTITTQEATRSLIAKGFLTETVSDTPTHSDLALAILRAAATGGLSVIVADALRTVAHLVETLNGPTHIKQLGEDIQGVLRILQGELADPNDDEEGHGRPTLMTAKLTNTVEQHCKTLERATTQLETCIDEASARAAKAAAHTTSALQARTVTYADAVREAPPPQLATAFAQSRARRLQITIRPERDTTATWQNLNDRETLTKVNIALTTAHENENTNGNEKPEELKARASQRTRNGALIIHMTTVEGAEWIQQPENMRAFLGALGGTTVHTPHNYTVIADFVPVTFDPESPTAISELEDNNGHENGQIASARYIKPMERRARGQRVAHVTIGFKTAEAANRAIKFGLFVECTKVNCRKMLQEPTRCVKCQFYNTGHVARTCNSIHDTCARCGEMHRTSTCAATDEQVACSNCRANNLPAHGHGAADRTCPVFAKTLRESRQRNTDAQYRYYPTADDPDSWETTHAHAPDIQHQGRTFQGGNRPTTHPPATTANTITITPRATQRPDTHTEPPALQAQRPACQARTFGDQIRPGTTLRQTTLPFQPAHRAIRPLSPPYSTGPYPGSQPRSWDNQVSEQGTGNPLFPRATPPNKE
ncbi:unnamed protein product [Mycena citricolor]|uniref:Gag-like protein n=1 Tax=Mycena citricolor TaxID=2018698 RepID=A0AAD2H604_9AGAR|nr:unnamed protein product [Mycena citricolor]